MEVGGIDRTELGPHFQEEVLGNTTTERRGRRYRARRKGVTHRDIENNEPSSNQSGTVHLNSPESIPRGTHPLSEMDFKLLSYNFIGLSSIEDRLKMRLFIVGLSPSIDIVNG